MPHVTVYWAFIAVCKRQIEYSWCRGLRALLLVIAAVFGPWSSYVSGKSGFLWGPPSSSLSVHWGNDWSSVFLPSWEEGGKLISAGSHCGELGADVSREGQLAIWFCCSQVRGWGTFRTSFWPPISCCQINWKKASKSDQPITQTYILISQGVPRAKCYCPWQSAALPLKYKHAPHFAPVELKSQDTVLSVCWLVLSLGHT